MQSYILQIFEYTYLKQYDLMIKYLLLSPNHIHYLGLSASIVDILNQINYNLKLIPLPVQLARYLPSRSRALSSDTSMDKDDANGLYTPDDDIRSGIPVHTYYLLNNREAMTLAQLKHIHRYWQAKKYMLLYHTTAHGIPPSIAGDSYKQFIGRYEGYSEYDDFMIEFIYRGYVTQGIHHLFHSPLPCLICVSHLDASKAYQDYIDAIEDYDELLENEEEITREEELSSLLSNSCNELAVHPYIFDYISSNTIHNPSHAANPSGGASNSGHIFNTHNLYIPNIPPPALSDVNSRPAPAAATVRLGNAPSGKRPKGIVRNAAPTPKPSSSNTNKTSLFGRNKSKKLTKVELEILSKENDQIYRESQRQYYVHKFLSLDELLKFTKNLNQLRNLFSQLSNSFDLIHILYLSELPKQIHTFKSTIFDEYIIKELFPTKLHEKKGNISSISSYNPVYPISMVKEEIYRDRLSAAAAATGAIGASRGANVNGLGTIIREEQVKKRHIRYHSLQKNVHLLFGLKGKYDYPLETPTLNLL
jgi:hypothetical protein